jgi:hypothetical protein
MPNKVKTARLCLLVAGWLKIATAGLFLFIFAAGFVFISGSNERSGLLGSALVGALGIVLAVASAAVGAIDIIAAVGIRRRSSWARVLGVILGVVMLPLLPVGTILGLFIIAGLLGAEAREWFTTGPADF